MLASMPSTRAKEPSTALSGDNIHRIKRTLPRGGAIHTRIYLPSNFVPAFDTNKHNYGRYRGEPCNRVRVKGIFTKWNIVKIVSKNKHPTKEAFGRSRSEVELDRNLFDDRRLSSTRRCMYFVCL